MKFRLLYGHHVDTDPKDRHKPADKQGEIRYSQGAIIETDQDLTKYNGRAGDARKFEMLDDTGTPREFSPFFWNREKETLEQFNQRMLGMNAAQVPEASKETHTSAQVLQHADRPVQTSAPATPPSPFTPGEDPVLALKSMSVSQLLKHAEAEEIDLSSLKGPAAKDKDQLVRVISAAMQPVGAK